MSNYKLIEIHDKLEWNKLTIKFKDLNIYHLWNYSKIVQKEKHVKHIALYEGKELLSIFQIRLKTIPVINRGIAYIFKGPIWQKKNSVNSFEAFKKILHAIRNEYVINQKLLLRIRPFLYSSFLSNSTYEIDIKNIFNVKYPLYNTLILDLQKDISQIRKNFRSNWRNHLNKAERNSIQIFRGVDQKLLDDFIVIYKEMLSRKKFTENIDLTSFYEFINRTETFNKPKLIIAYSNNIPISGIIFSSVGDIGISLFRATNEIGMRLNASYIIQFETIKWLKELGASIYDLGGIDPINNPNVFNFKLGISDHQTTDLGLLESSNNAASKTLVYLGEHINKFKRWI